MRRTVQQEVSLRRALRQNAAWFVLTIPFLLLPYAMPSERLPELCLFRRLTGFPCAFCGFTRAFEGMAHGHFHEAMLDCPAAGLLYLGMWLAFISALGPTLKRQSMSISFSAREQRILLAAAGLILLAGWVWRLSV